jgi:hypothetical protein
LLSIFDATSFTLLHSNFPCNTHCGSSTHCDGVEEGNVVGDTEGVCDGSFEGVLDGTSVGNSDGELLGERDGVCVIEGAVEGATGTLSDPPQAQHASTPDFPLEIVALIKSQI